MNDIAKESLKSQLNYWYARIWQNESSDYARGHYWGICKTIALMGYDWEMKESGEHIIFDYEV